MAGFFQEVASHLLFGERLVREHRRAEIMDDESGTQRFWGRFRDICGVPFLLTTGDFLPPPSVRKLAQAANEEKQLSKEKRGPQITRDETTTEVSSGISSDQGDEHKYF